MMVSAKYPCANDWSWWDLSGSSRKTSMAETDPDAGFVHLQLDLI